MRSVAESYSPLIVHRPMSSSNPLELRISALRQASARVDRLDDLLVTNGLTRHWRAESPPHLDCPRPELIDLDRERFFFMPQSPLRDQHAFPLSELRLDCLADARLIGEKFVVVSHDRQVFSESYWSLENLNDGAYLQCLAGGPGLAQRPPRVVLRDPTPTRTLAGAALLLAQPWAFNYHHWMINSLARLWWLEQHVALRDVPVLLPRTLNSFQHESLAALGLPNEQRLPFDATHWQIERLYFPASGDFWPAQLQWIRQRVYSYYGIPIAVPHRRLYISRGDAPNRRVLNESALIACLQSLGFETVQLATIPFIDQVRLLSEAQIVVGPHGSGLTNIVFGPETLTLLELHPRDTMNHVFWVLASALRQRYALLSGPVVNQDRDFTVDLNELRQILDQLL